MTAGLAAREPSLGLGTSCLSCGESAVGARGLHGICLSCAEHALPSTSSAGPASRPWQRLSGPCGTREGPVPSVCFLAHRECRARALLHGAGPAHDEAPRLREDPMAVLQTRAMAVRFGRALWPCAMAVRFGGAGVVGAAAAPKARKAGRLASGVWHLAS